jgi:hypothetical protein
LLSIWAGLVIAKLNVEKCDKANNENLEDARKYKFENEI